MESIRPIKKIKDTLNLRHRLGNIMSLVPKTGLMPKPPPRPRGISALMRLKNEAQWIEPTLRSLAPFVDQFSIVDNGSTDGTPEIVRSVCDELNLDYILEILPTEDFGEVCDLALANTTRRWVLRWDGDMIARTQGEKTLKKLTEFVLSLDEDRYYTVYFPHVQLEGDLSHQDPESPIHYEDYLFTYSSRLYHKRTGRFREVIYPLYYKRIYTWDTYSFHIASLDDPEAMILRKYWVEWRSFANHDTYPTLEDFAGEKIRREYGTGSLFEAGALFMRDRFRSLVPYNAETYGEYPDLLKPHLDTFPLHLVYRNGRIAGRNDFIDTLDRLDSEKRTTTIDIIVPTRGRRDYPVDTVRALLEQDYPSFGIIVVDQNDRPLEDIAHLAETRANVIHHITSSRGLPAARNDGTALSDAEIVIFVDDDIIPEQGFIDGHVLAYRNDSVGGTGGRIFEKRREANKPVPPRRIGSINYWIGEIYRGYTDDKPRDIVSSPGGNMSFRRRILKDAGGFDTRFDGTFLFEETDMCLRMRNMGYTIRYAPDAVLTHLGAPSGGCRLDEQVKVDYWYGHNFMLLYLKHFPRRTFPVFFTVRVGKFIRDSLLNISPSPLLAGLKGMGDALGTFRRDKTSC